VGTVEGWVDRMRVVIVEGRDSFGGEFEASHCNQWGRRRALPKLRYFGEDLFLFLAQRVRSS